MKTCRVALIGNPNCGKSTLFNRFTGARQTVGNWSGVTVAERQGYCKVAKTPLALFDLPGLYSLSDGSDSQDVAITRQFLQSRKVDVLLNVIDASQLERQLFLTAQLLEYQIPMIVVLNMQDVAARRGVHVDTQRLAQQLGCPVLTTVAHIGTGQDALCQALAQIPPLSQAMTPYPEPIVATLKQRVPPPGESVAGQLQRLTAAEVTATTQEALSDDLDSVISDARYRFVHAICQQVVNRQAQRETWSKRIDNVVLHRVFALPIFFFIMYLTFVIGVNFGGVFQEFFALTTQAVFIDLPAQWLQGLQAPAWLQLLQGGVGVGINTTLTFIPVLFMLFVMLSLLEGSGYMPRAAFVMDRLMSKVGLSGKAFLPLIIGFGCNVPAIMASRTLDQSRERVTMILMAPFMSCSARLAVYAVFVSAFFPRHGGAVIFSLYLIGIACAILTGLLLQRFWFQYPASPLVVELPPYQRPQLLAVSRLAWARLQGFLWRAGKIIIPVCMLLNVLNAVILPGSSVSLLASVGQLFTPVLSPMGITAENWPATVGLITGGVAKEVLIGSLNTLYSHMTPAPDVLPSVELATALQQALWSIPQNAYNFVSGFFNPLSAMVMPQSLSQSSYGEFVTRFQSARAAYAYLLFVLLYLPCVSTFAVTVRELNWRYAWLGLAWSLGLAYAVAVTFYQLSAFTHHPWQSAVWVSAVVVLLASLCAGFSWQRRKLQGAL
jgi:ferrous iron transport protein B